MTEPGFARDSEYADVRRRLDIVEEHLRNAADQLQQVLHLYQELQQNLNAVIATTTTLRRQFNAQFPEKWNCAACSRSVPRPQDPNEPQTCPFCGKKVRAVLFMGASGDAR